MNPARSPVWPTPRDLEVLGAVIADDRQWFAANPDRLDRIRPVIPGEAPPLGAPPHGHVWVAWVIRSAPGRVAARTRKHCALPEALAGPEVLDPITSLERS